MPGNTVAFTTDTECLLLYHCWQGLAFHHLDVSDAHVATVMPLKLALFRMMKKCQSTNPNPNFRRVEKIAARVIGLMEDETTV